MFDIRPVDRHFAAIDTIADFPGVVIPKKHTEIRERWASMLTETDTISALAAAIITGKNDLHRATLDAWTAAEASTASRAAVVNESGGPVYLALLDAYQPQAQQNYARVASMFNQHAAALHEAVSTCDVEAPADAMVGADDASRASWLTAQLSAESLGAILPVMTAAAELCGAHIASKELELPLIADLDGCHRRRIWETLNTAGRCGRWGALIAAGATLRAHPQPLTIVAYDAPPPMEIRQIRTPGAIGIRQVQHDPADDEFAGAVPA